MNDNTDVARPCCAHLTVKYVTEDVGEGTVRGWWECSECRTRFWPEISRQREIDEATKPLHLRIEELKSLLARWTAGTTEEFL